MCLERCKTFISEKFLVGNKLQLTTVGAFSSQQAGLQSRGWGWPCPAGALVLRLSAFALGTHCHLRLFLILVIEYPPRRKKGMWVGLVPGCKQIPLGYHQLPGSWVAGRGQACLFLQHLVALTTPCHSNNTYQFVPSRCFLSMNIIPLSEKQIFLFSLYIKRDRGERKEKIHLPPILPVPASAKEPLSECGRGLISAFSPPGCLSLLFWFYYLSISL